MLKKILEILKYIGGVTGMVAIIAGIAVSNYKAKQERQSMIKNDSVLIREVRDINSLISTQAGDINTIKSNLKTQGDEQAIIKKYVIRHVLTNNPATIEEIQQMFQDFEKKNNGYNFAPIVSEQDK